MSVDLLIVSGKVGSGKTTALKSWLQKQEKVGGVLSPKIEGKRYFEFIPSGDLIPMESDDASLEIGNFIFSAAHFSESEARVQSDWNNPEIDTVVIDEIGPLEIRKGLGFHHLLNGILHYKITVPKRLILVVRDYCLHEFFNQYEASKFRIITEQDLNPIHFPHAHGIVLCGGKSVRMGTDKALLKYHGVPQWQYIYNLMLPFCEEVYLSLNAHQAGSYSISENVQVIADNDLYKNHGPLTGVMSVINKLGNEALFIVACDYPFLKMEHLFDLINHRKWNGDAICYRNSGHAEPLISILEPPAIEELKQYFKDGKDSLSRFMDTLNTAYIDVANPRFLQNVNNQEDFRKIENTNNKNA